MAIFCVEVIFVALGCWILFGMEGKQLIGVWPAEVGYEMITNHFRRYTYMELQTANQKFKDQIGCGASGLVYKGVLKDKRAVAVKRLADINQGEEEFQHELSVIGKIYHMNLVRVWGFCSDGPHRIPVLEYVENGSLDKALFSSDSQILHEWNERFKTALEWQKDWPIFITNAWSGLSTVTSSLRTYCWMITWSQRSVTSALQNL